MAISDFLKNVTYGGKPITSNVDPSSGGLTKVNTPFLYGLLLQAAAQPGGVLSPITTDKAFASLVQNIVTQGASQDQQQQNALAEAGVNPLLSSQILAAQPYKQLSQIAGVKGGLEKEKAETEFGAMQALANAISSATLAEKQLGWQSKYYKLQKKKMGISNILGGLGLLTSFASGIGALDALGNKLFPEAKPGEIPPVGGGGPELGSFQNPWDLGMGVGVPDQFTAPASYGGGGSAGSMEPAAFWAQFMKKQ